MNIKFLKPEFPPIYSYILDLIKIHKNNQFSNNGEYVQKFENKLKEYLGEAGRITTKPVCVANATVGLAVALKSLGLKGGAIVYTTSFTFPATVQVIKDLGYEPIYVDIDKQYMSMCRKDLCKKISEFGTENAAIMPVCSYGGYIDWNVIGAYGLPTVVDAAGAIGTYYTSYADAIVYSFHATKCLPVGEGGCIIFKDKEKEKWARRAIDFGFDSKREVVQWGLNGKMTEYEAAIGLKSLRRLNSVLARRYVIYLRYVRMFQKFAEKDGEIGVISNDGLQLLTIVCKTPEIKDLLKYHLNSHGIETRVYYNPCHLQEFLAKKSELPTTEDLSRRIISLPLYSSLTNKELNYIKKVIDKWEHINE